MIGDSECTLSSIEKVSASFGEFFGNRIGEIQSNQAKIEEFCPVGESGEWWWLYMGDFDVFGPKIRKKSKNQKSASYKFFALFLSTYGQKIRFQGPKLKEEM